MENFIRKCRHCNQPLNGRLNKQFHPNCKSIYNNAKAKKKRDLLKFVFNIISKNEAILTDLYEYSKSKGGVDEDVLLNKGFRFEYLTHTVKNNQTNSFIKVMGNYGWYMNPKNTLIIIIKI